MAEEWKPVCNYPRHEISTLGRLRFIKANRILAGSLDTHGYREAKLYHPTPGVNLKHMRYHQMVARAFIPNPDNHLFVDHISGDRLDNRVENLRWCSSSQNSHNSKKTRAGKSTCDYKGVYLQKKRWGEYWTAQISCDGQHYYLGNSHKTAEDAARAYDAKAKELFGEFAKLNFPSDAVTV